MAPVLAHSFIVLFTKVISEVLGSDVRLINVGETAAQYLKEILKSEDKLCSEKKPVYEFYASDSKSGFDGLAKMFLKRDLGTLKSVDIDKIKED